MDIVNTIIKVLIALGSIALVVFVLLQPSKEGMSSAITGLDDTAMRGAVRKSRPEMRYAFMTKVLAIAIGVLCLVSVFISKF
jgi:protein translocase SecG subunit